MYMKNSNLQNITAQKNKTIQPAPNLPHPSPKNLTKIKNKTTQSYTLSYSNHNNKLNYFIHVYPIC